ncbi:MAG: TerB N-terminal domain-containing protein [Clostridia bacterium]|nr:TerB N-terminal domain-containing protein [Clostridia bacterium]
MSDKEKRNAIDDFWNIDSLVPKKRTPAVFDDKHTEAAEIEIPLPGKEAQNAPKTEKIPEDSVIKRYIHPHTAESEKKKVPDEEYTPENSLIHSVRLYSWSSAYPYYEQFRRAAIFYYNKTSHKVEAEPYFSYMPQYSQLNDRQLAYYLWFRSEIRAGRYPSVDYSYILLLIYETINLSDKLPRERSVDLLANLWLNYREDYPRLDVQLSEWIFDMCLLGKMEPPRDILGVVGNSLPATAGLREFYADAVGDAGAFASLLIRHCSNYNFKKSKFAVGEHVDLYKKHMHGVLAYMISKSNDPAHPFEFAGLKLQDSRTQRDTYTGALCSPKVKKRIEIEFCSFSHSHELRFIVTDILKYAENRIRAHIGVKSRLSLNALPAGIKALAEEYFNRELPIRSVHPSVKDEVPEYEKLYEPTSSGLSFDSAAKIEALSWETTEKLVETFVDEENPIILEPENIPEPVEEESETDFIDGLSDSEKEFVLAALEGDGSKQSAIAARESSLPDIIADRINTLAADIFGDIILEDLGGSYGVLEDYEEELRGALENGK